MEKQKLNLEDFVNLALEAMDNGYLEDSLLYLDKAIEISSVDDDVAYFVKADILNRIGDDAGSREVIETHFLKNKSDPNIYARFGCFNYMKNDFKRTGEWYSAALRCSPSNLFYQFMIGLSYFLDQKWNKSIEILTLLIEKDLTNSDALYLLGQSYNNTKKFSMAECFFKKVLSVDPEYSEAHFGLGIVFENQKNFKMAVDCFEKYVASSHSNFTYTILHLIYKEKFNNTLKAEKFKKLAMKHTIVDSGKIMTFKRFQKYENEIQEFRDGKLLINFKE